MHFYFYELPKCLLAGCIAPFADPTPCHPSILDKTHLQKLNLSSSPPPKDLLLFYHLAPSNKKSKWNLTKKSTIFVRLKHPQHPLIICIIPTINIICTIHMRVAIFCWEGQTSPNPLPLPHSLSLSTARVPFVIHCIYIREILASLFGIL